MKSDFVTLPKMNRPLHNKKTSSNGYKGIHGSLYIPACGFRLVGGALHYNSITKIMANIKKIRKRLHYKTFQQRLSDENIRWLQIENNKYESWNLFFNELRERYKKYGDFKKHFK